MTPTADSPRDLLAAILNDPAWFAVDVEEIEEAALEWLGDFGSDVLALIDAARVDVEEYLEWRSIPGNEHKATSVMDTLVAALAPLVKP